MPPSRRADVIVVGLGPAGRAAAARCLARGLDVIAVDPQPTQAWLPTYAAWLDELPDYISDAALAARISRPSAFGTTAHVIDRQFVVLDNARLQAELNIDGARIIADRVINCGPDLATLASAGTLRGTVIDTRTNLRRANSVEQTAYGVVVDRQAAAPALGSTQALFMDWRRDNGTAANARPSFLYAIPINADEVLLEETCLAGSPAIQLSELRQRLGARLRNRGVAVPASARTERVQFPLLGSPSTGKGEALNFGARGGLMHPATGFSVAASLEAAETIAAAIATGTDPARALWPKTARSVHRLRRIGLNALLDFAPTDIPEFFDAFFELDSDAQAAYLSGRDDLSGTMSAMWQLYRTVPRRLRSRMRKAAFTR